MRHTSFAELQTSSAISSLILYAEFLIYVENKHKMKRQIMQSSPRIVLSR